ncbi:MAG: exosortase C-terminal domain/associated protein EpsI [Candidatus Omnitrophota bacterium]
MSNNKTGLTVIGLLALTLLGLIYLWQLRNIAPSQVRLEDIPMELGEWKGMDLPITKRVYKILETEDVLMREYINTKGEKVSLAIVYSGASRAAFHPPEICYLGDGRELLAKNQEIVETRGPVENQNLRTNKLLMKDRHGQEIAWYWFTAGDKVTENYYLQQCYFTWNELSRNPAGGSLIRVSARTASNDPSQADATGKDFIKQLAPLLAEYIIPGKKSPT